MTFVGYNQNFALSTPNWNVSEGKRPAQHFQVAAYLPLIRFDNRMLEFKVINGGKIVARDSRNYIVPAGYALDIKTAKAEGVFTNCVNKYTQTDRDNGVKNFAGVLVTAGEAVVKSFFTTTAGVGDATKALINYVSAPIGLAPQDCWRQNGAGYGPGYTAGNPLDYNYTNFNLQQGTTVLTRSFIELPVVTDLATLKMVGMSVFEGAPTADSLVTFTAHSNLTSVAPLAQPTIAVPGTATVEELEDAAKGITTYLNNTIGNIVGKILFVDDQWPKDLLEYVRVWEPTSTLGDNARATAGSFTKGLTDQLYLAGQTTPSTAKMVRINILL